jgi:hypothetical protein
MLCDTTADSAALFSLWHASDRVTDKAASSIDKKGQNKTSNTATSFTVVKANKRPIEQATKRPHLFRENKLLVACDGDEGTNRATGKATSSSLQ